jgi:prolipoprotein diacylglyceryl transferase
MSLPSANRKACGCNAERLNPCATVSRDRSGSIELGPFAIRWYALAYVFGLLGGWAYAYVLVRSDRLWRDTPHPSPESLIDLLLYVMLGTIIGGRLGQVILYEPGYYMAHPLEIFEVWNGGMAFHGGLIGVLLAIWYFVHRFKISFLTISDICAATCPIPIFLVRIANFINSEQWGRPTDVPWAVVFPDVDAHRVIQARSTRRFWKDCCFCWCLASSRRKAVSGVLDG